MTEGRTFMKKYFRYIVKVIICLFVVLFYTTVNQAEETTSTIHYSLSNDGTLRISGNGTIADKQVMDQYKENTIRLIIDEGITDLQNVGLLKFTKLRSVQLPKTLKVIHEKTFTKCKSLKEISIPGVTYIGSEAFSYCKSLKIIKNADTVEEIGHAAFGDCTSLKWPSFGTKLKKIDTAAFFSCVSFKNVTIPDSVTEIKNQAFCYCENLQKIVLPASLQTWKKNVTERCPKLKTIVNRSRLSCQIYDFDGYRIWKTNGKPVKNVPAKKTAVSKGKKLKITYELEGGQITEKLPKYYEYGTTLRVPQTLKKKGCVMAGWTFDDEKPNDKDGIYESVDRRLYLGPVTRKPVAYPIWLEYSAGNTRKGTVELKIGDPEYVHDDDGYYTYIVRYSEHKNMKNAKSIKISGYPAKATFRNLKKGMSYYFQVGPVPDESTKPDYWLKKHRIKIIK